MNPAEPLSEQIGQWQQKAMMVAGAGLVLSLIGLFVDREQLLRSYLYAYLYGTGLGLGCLGILLLHQVVGGRWGLVIRRFCEAGARTLPYMGILLIPVLVGMGTLYSWTRPEAANDANIQSKHLYLNVPFFIGRAVFYFLIWTFYANRLSRWSAEQDQTGDERLIARMRGFSAPALLVFVLTTTFAFFDWIMSLEPHWFSTIYGAMFLIGQVLSAFALIIALLIVLSRQAPLKDYVTPQHLHDLGNLMFAFMVLWAYLSFSQFLIIWAGNLPEEIAWYLHRLAGGWSWVASSLIVFHFCAPFVVLLQRGVKRSPELLYRVCLFMLAIRLVDVYWIVEPSFYESGLTVHWMDVATLLLAGGAWLALFFWQLKSRPLVPLRDPRLREVPREMVAF